MGDRPSGIKGLEGRRPIGAALTIGRKRPRDPKNPGAKFGFPEHRDRFYVVAGMANADDVKPPHPRFERFNNAPAKARQYVEGRLTNATREKCFQYNYRCQSPRRVPRHQKPSGRLPFCTGNGEVAQRWDSGNGKYGDIVCPGKMCEFQQPEGKAGKPCKPFATFVFRLRIPSYQLGIPEEHNPFPPITVKFATGAWGTTSNLLGLFEEFDEQVANLGMQGASLFGFPFGLQLMETKNEKGRFPIVSVTPLMEVLDFLGQQHEQMQQIGAQPRYALTDRSAADEDQDYADYAPGARVVEG